QLTTKAQTPAQQSPDVEPVPTSRAGSAGPGEPSRQAHQSDESADLRHLRLGQSIEVSLAKDLNPRVARHLHLLGAFRRVDVIEHLELPAGQRRRLARLGLPDLG